jgi:predicted transposase/invertase (TIGR01784 family)
MLRFVDPKNDVAFKKVFADSKHKHILIHFLNSVLDLASPIKEITIVKSDQVPVIEILKETSLDLKAVDEKGREFVIEMQVEDQKDFQNRSLYYAAKSYAHQLKKAEYYKELKPVIFLGILNFNLFDGDEFLTNHYIINQQTGNRDIKDMELNFIELPKFTKTEKECETLADKWIYFIKNAEDLRVIPENVKVEEIKLAYETVEQFGWTEEELSLYEARSRFVASQLDALETATFKGLKLGEKIGIKKGMEKGAKKAKLEIARNLLDVFDNKTIAEKTGLTEEEIEELRE